MNKSATPPEHTFFLDENLGGSKVQNALTAAGYKVAMHNDHFSKGTKDQDWLPTVGQNGWILFTQDKNIRKHAVEVLALKEAGVRAFILSCKGLRGEQIGELLVKSMPQILRIIKKYEPPFIATVDRSHVKILDGSPRYPKGK